MTIAIDFSDLPEPEEIAPDVVEDAGRESLVVEPSEIIASDKTGPVCEGCGEVIIREPGSRGRAPKYHPHCRPAKVARGSQRGTKALSAENEVELAVAKIRKKLMQGAMLLAMVNQYDGFVVAMAIPDICENIAGVLGKYEKLRKEVLGVQGYGSVLGLVLTVVLMVLPILANHKLIPTKFLSKLMLNLPYVMHQVHQRLEEGPEKMAEIMFEQLRQKKQEEARKQQGANESAA